LLVPLHQVYELSSGSFPPHSGSSAWSLPLGTGFIAALHTFIGQDLKHGVKF
jgi:hypothetical protein